MGTMLPRTLAATLDEVARVYPIVTVTGPRQSGKTTLCRAVFGDKPWVNLEDPDLRRFATTDPRAFLDGYRDGAIFDEVQRTPELPSYLQGMVDLDARPGRFVLTGSQNLMLLASTSQSLAGRTAVLNLLPLSYAESMGSAFEHAEGTGPKGRSLWQAVFEGGYPAIVACDIPPERWLADYVATYLERDVRQILNVTQLEQFQTFLGVCAGHTGQLVNLSQLGAACGVTHNTARAWLSVLQASFIVHELRPYAANVNKRLVKTPKLHFWDTGLACYLLGIRDASQLATHPLRGALFETWVTSEVCKAILHRGARPRVWFYRDRRGLEVDLVVERRDGLVLVETKSGRTIAADFFDALTAASEIIGAGARVLVYGGDSGQRRTNAEVVAWSDLDGVAWD